MSIDKFLPHIVCQSLLFKGVLNQEQMFKIPKHDANEISD
jgi:hypothetical protein